MTDPHFEIEELDFPIDRNGDDEPVLIKADDDVVDEKKDVDQTLEPVVDEHGSDAVRKQMMIRTLITVSCIFYIALAFYIIFFNLNLDSRNVLENMFTSILIGVVLMMCMYTVPRLYASILNYCLGETHLKVNFLDIVPITS